METLLNNGKEKVENLLLRRLLTCRGLENAAERICKNADQTVSGTILCTLYRHQWRVSNDSS